MGFDYDEAMDRFVYVFEKLSEQNYRRLKSIRYEGSYGDLSPWLRTVVQNFSISWLRSIEGRKRLLKPITKLSRMDQRVFELYFWKGRSPSMISEELELKQMHADLGKVLDCLERIFSVLTQNNRWRLMSQIAKISRMVRIDETMGATGTRWHPATQDANPEQLLLQKEMQDRMTDTMKGLPAEDQLLLNLRYIEGATLKQLSAVFRTAESQVQNRLKSLLFCMRKKLRS
jgi:RNA polymerase sigma factor (sigma-70 family)